MPEELKGGTERRFTPSASRILSELRRARVKSKHSVHVQTECGSLRIGLDLLTDLTQEQFQSIGAHSLTNFIPYSQSTYEQKSKKGVLQSIWSPVQRKIRKQFKKISLRRKL